MIAVAAIAFGVLVSIAPARRAVDLPVIRINAAIGNVSMFATRASVESRYGAPESTQALVLADGAGLVARYRTQDRLLLVTYDALNRVVAIETHSPAYRTSTGVGPGSPASGLDKLGGFRTDFCTLGRWNGNASTDATDIVTVFGLAGDRIDSVLIAQAALHTACNTSSGELSAAVGDGGYLVTAAVSPPGSGYVQSTPGGINCPVDCSELLAPGSTLSIVARPSGGMILQRWEGDCEVPDPTAPCVVRANGARHVVAHFVTAPPPPPPPPPPDDEPPPPPDEET